MPKKAMETLTESMFYLLMVLKDEPLCGTDAAAAVTRRSHGRVHMGPATLYTLLSRFLEKEYIQEIDGQKGRRTYRLTAEGDAAFAAELRRLRRCLDDAGGDISHEREE